MKSLIAIITLFLCLLRFNSYAQYPGENRNDYSPYGLDYIQLSASTRQLATHEDATQITYFDLNFVDQLMQDFMRKEMGMAVVHFPFFGKENGYRTLTVKYSGQATMGTTKIQYLIFKYILFDNKDKHTIIKSLNISGASNKVIYFYAAYWPTTMNFDGSKNKIAYNYLWQDKATMRFNGAWTITIENTTIKNIADYENKIKLKSLSFPSNTTMNKIANNGVYSSNSAVITSNEPIKTSTQDNLLNLENKREIVKRDSLLKVENEREIVKRDILLKIENKRDTLLRDSLLNIAKTESIPFQLQSSYKFDIDYLRNGINYDRQLSKGDNYYTGGKNDFYLDIYKSLLHYPQNKNMFIHGRIIIKIDKEGIIKEISPAPNASNDNLPQNLIDHLNRNLVGKKTTPPFTANGKYYPSFLRFMIGITEDKVSMFETRTF